MYNYPEGLLVLMGMDVFAWFACLSPIIILGVWMFWNIHPNAYDSAEWNEHMNELYDEYDAEMRKRDAERNIRTKAREWDDNYKF